MTKCNHEHTELRHFLASFPSYSPDGKTKEHIICDVPYWKCEHCDDHKMAEPDDFIPSGDYWINGNLAGI